MKNWMQPQNLGYLVAFLRLGFIVQYVGENLCRCVQVADDERSLLFLANNRVEESAGLNADVSVHGGCHSGLFAYQNNMVPTEPGTWMPFAHAVEGVHVHGVEVA